MKLTNNDKAHLNPVKEIKKKRRPKTFHNWPKINEKHGGKTVRVIHNETGIHKGVLYRAAEQSLLDIEYSQGKRANA